MKKVTSKDGTTIAFDQLGDGPALILGSGAFRYRAIDPQTAQLAALLAPHYTVFHYERRGRGDSGDTQPYAIQREVEDLEAIIDEAVAPTLAYNAAMMGAEASVPVGRAASVPCPDSS